VNSGYLVRIFSLLAGRGMLFLGMGLVLFWRFGELMDGGMERESNEY